MYRGTSNDSSNARRRRLVRAYQSDILDFEWFKVTSLYGGKFIMWAFMYLVFSAIWPDLILSDFGQLGGRGVVMEGLSRVWLIFTWGFGVTLLNILINKQRYTSEYPKPELFGRAGWLSFHAGFFEEFIYRGYIFLVSMVVLRVLNVVTFGFVQYASSEFFLPLANVMTFGNLEQQLFHPQGWVFGASLVFANGLFRDGHSYQGLIGYINSWFIGMVMFWLVFNYGMGTAIMAHFVYDLLIFGLIAATSEYRPANPIRLSSIFGG